MTILRDFSTMYASLFSLVVFMSLFESRYSRKKTISLALIMAVPLLLVNFILLALLGPEKMGTLILITCSLPSLIFLWFLSKHRDGRFFFTFCLGDTLILEILHLSKIIDYFLGDTYYFLVFSRLIASPLLAWLAYKWVRPTYLNVQQKVHKGWTTFAVISLIFYVVLSLSMSYPTMITERTEYLPAHLLLLLLMPMIYLHIFSTLRHQQGVHEMAERDNILQVQVTNLRSRIDDFTTADEKFRMERHNFRHKMQAIAALVDNGRYEELRELVQDYSQAIQDTQVKRYCSHTVLDAVLSSYLQQAERCGIRIVTRLSFPDTLPVSEAELSTVFANALENAIHACEKLEPENRYLEIKVLTAPRFMFQIRNSFDGQITFDPNGIPVSSQKEHGFGTRSIAAFCEKCGALYEFTADEEYFTLRISV